MPSTASNQFNNHTRGVNTGSVPARLRGKMNHKHRKNVAEIESALAHVSKKDLLLNTLSQKSNQEELVINTEEGRTLSFNRENLRLFKVPWHAWERKYNQIVVSPFHRDLTFWMSKDEVQAMSNREWRILFYFDSSSLESPDWTELECWIFPEKNDVDLDEKTLSVYKEIKAESENKSESENRGEREKSQKKDIGISSILNQDQLKLLYKKVHKNISRSYNICFDILTKITDEWFLKEVFIATENDWALMNLKKQEHLIECYNKCRRWYWKLEDKILASNPKWKVLLSLIEMSHKKWMVDFCKKLIQLMEDGNLKEELLKILKKQSNYIRFAH